MKLAEEMLGLEALRERRCEVSDQARLRRRQYELHGLRIDDFNCHAFTADQHIILRFFIDLWIKRKIVVPEFDIFGRERHAVRPFVALAQREGHFCIIIVP